MELQIILYLVPLLMLTIFTVFRTATLEKKIVNLDAKVEYKTLRKYKPGQRRSRSKPEVVEKPVRAIPTVEEVKAKNPSLFTERKPMKVDDKPKRKKHTHLSAKEKKELCQYKKDHPDLATQIIAAYYDVSTSTVDRIIEEKH